MMRPANLILAGVIVAACSSSDPAPSDDPVRSEPIRVQQLPPIENGMWYDPKVAPEFHALINTRACDLTAEFGRFQNMIDANAAKALQQHLSRSLAVKKIRAQAWRFVDADFNSGIDYSGEVWCLTVPQFEARYALMTSTNALAQTLELGEAPSFLIGPGFRGSETHPNVEKLHSFEFNSVGIPVGGTYQDIIEDRDCHLALSFGSFGAGPPRAHIIAMVDRLMDRDDVTKIYTQAWGREGEQDYCAVIPDETARASVLADMELIDEALGRAKNSPMSFGLLPEQPPGFVPYREPELVRYPGTQKPITDREAFAQWYRLLESGDCHVTASRGPHGSETSETRAGLQMGRREGVEKMYFVPWGKQSQASFCYEIPDEAKRQVIFEKILNDPEVKGYTIVEVAPEN
jgi:hypothetical protein